MRIKRGDGLRSSLFESRLCIVIVGFVIFGQWIFDIKDICRCMIVCMIVIYCRCMIVIFCDCVVCDFRLVNLASGRAGSGLVKRT